MKSCESLNAQKDSKEKIKAAKNQHDDYGTTTERVVIIDKNSRNINIMDSGSTSPSHVGHVL